MEKKIYIGWDSRETLAYDVAVNSISRRNNTNIEISPISNKDLDSIMDDNLLVPRSIEIKDGKMWCPISNAPMSTEFAISRFCVPFLQKSGWALFMDCDMIVLTDIQELFNLADDKYAVMVVKHGKLEGEGIKMDGQTQTVYPRKNWSSVVLWNLNHPANKKLTIEMLNTYAGRDLHAFCWLRDDEIGELPAEWNYLVDVNLPIANPKIAHYTLGGAWINGWKNKESDEPWLKEFNSIFKE